MHLVTVFMILYCAGASTFGETTEPVGASMMVERARFQLSCVVPVRNPKTTKLVEKLQERVNADYKRLPYPISGDLFLVTQDGVAGTRAA